MIGTQLSFLKVFMDVMTANTWLNEVTCHLTVIYWSDSTACVGVGYNVNEMVRWHASFFFVFSCTNSAVWKEYPGCFLLYISNEVIRDTLTSWAFVLSLSEDIWLIWRTWIKLAMKCREAKKYIFVALVSNSLCRFGSTYRTTVKSLDSNSRANFRNLYDST